VLFFNIDCHISVIRDIQNIFKNLGFDVHHWSLSGHRWVFNLPKCPSPIINENNWASIDEEMVERFYKYHRSELDKYDAFICCYPPCFLKLFERFNKPIIVVAATRYDYPFLNNTKKLKWLEDSLNNNNNLILITNNEFDKYYCEKFLEKKWENIPSLCDYTETNYSPSVNKRLLFSKFINLNNTTIIHQSKLDKYSWSDLCKYQCIVHFPYNVSTMSIFEQYQAGIPLLFPSLEYSLKMIQNNIPLFSEITFPNSIPERQSHNFMNELWLSKSDFYNGTIKCQYFDQKTDLENIKIDKIKKQSNKDIVYDRWENLIKKLF